MHDTTTNRSMSKAVSLGSVGTTENPFVEPEAITIAGVNPGTHLVAAVMWYVGAVPAESVCATDVAGARVPTTRIPKQGSAQYVCLLLLHERQASVRFFSHPAINASVWPFHF